MAGIIVAAAFAVCSGDASDAVTSAAEATVAKATARFELTSEFPDTSHPHLTIIEATGHVAMDASLRADLSISHMLIEIPGAGPTDIVVNGDDVYIRGGLFTDIPGCSPTEWIQTDPSRAEADMDDASILGEGMGDVRLFIYYLFGPSGTPRELGEESIDGWLARHYSTTLDLQKANDVAPTDIRTVLTADLAEMREAGIRTSPLPPTSGSTGAGSSGRQCSSSPSPMDRGCAWRRRIPSSDLRCGISQTQQTSASARCEPGLAKRRALGSHHLGARPPRGRTTRTAPDRHPSPRHVSGQTPPARTSPGGA